MAETKTFTVQCPDEDCAAEFTAHVPVADLAEDAEPGALIMCPECGEEWEWNFDPETETFELCEDDDNELTDEEEDDDLADEFEGAE